MRVSHARHGHECEDEAPAWLGHPSILAQAVQRRTRSAVTPMPVTRAHRRSGDQEDWDSLVKRGGPTALRAVEGTLRSRTQSPHDAPGVCVLGLSVPSRRRPPGASGRRPGHLQRDLPAFVSFVPLVIFVLTVGACIATVNVQPSHPRADQTATATSQPVKASVA
jgi:hypothetical protein